MVSDTASPPLLPVATSTNTLRIGSTHRLRPNPLIAEELRSSRYCPCWNADASPRCASGDMMYARSPAASAGRPRRCLGNCAVISSPTTRSSTTRTWPMPVPVTTPSPASGHTVIYSMPGDTRSRHCISTVARFTGGRPLGVMSGDRWRDPGTRLAVAKSTSTAAGGPPCAPESTPPLLFSPRQHG
jgi:hypothetical protein